MTAVCGEDGEWRPNPGDVECRKNDTLSTGKAYIGVFVCELAMPRNIIYSLQAFNDLLETQKYIYILAIVSALVYHPLSTKETIQLGDLVWLHELLYRTEGRTLLNTTCRKSKFTFVKYTV